MAHNQRRSSDEVGSISGVGDNGRCGIRAARDVAGPGRHATEGPARARIRPLLIFTHFGLAASGLVLWIVYVITDTDAIAWVAFAIVAVVAGLGFAMLAVWLQRRRPPTAAGPAAGGPAEQHFPATLVTFHGIVAATTLVTVVLAAAGVGS